MNFPIIHLLLSNFTILHCVITTGNPYSGCSLGALERVSCGRGNICGGGALCTDRPDGVDCSCPAGYKGNPYVQCVGEYMLYL